jgi:hypothetical protein
MEPIAWRNLEAHYDLTEDSLQQQRARLRFDADHAPRLRYRIAFRCGLVLLRLSQRFLRYGRPAQTTSATFATRQGRAS